MYIYIYIYIYIYDILKYCFLKSLKLHHLDGFDFKLHKKRKYNINKKHVWMYVWMAYLNKKRVFRSLFSLLKCSLSCFIKVILFMFLKCVLDHCFHRLFYSYQKAPRSVPDFWCSCCLFLKAHLVFVFVILGWQAALMLYHIHRTKATPSVYVF